MRTWCLIPALVLCLVPVLSLARQSGDGRAPAQLGRDIAAAEARNDVKFLDRAWAPDYTEINQFGAVHTKAERIASVRAKHTEFQSVRVLEDNVRGYGDTAVVAMRLSVQGKVRGKPVDGDVRALSIFVRRGNRWQAVATQYTRVQGH